ncbi:MAG: hypothetical protein A3C80_01180 [Candidatus Ryanbacteria bacterium RIFCSPHIGHO2_02_FULL_45_43]|uniref:Cupin type-2 domain-containing protein n=1 Tax=Candidatus Ryanbacteria bacterium RIFCSPHIGHO2_01_45_13 TaxID=1802112 RepID=A0A1G2FZ27_9BACT|nr:MAG: hypothetical protein A2718_03410 [Candidatus Ryanbacteria bacterium RIFCSPHIGHO2_01_FULL_44_130]OGZ42868.1 MAG: hypothetical protein A2W41_01965 [Candidatus Ryanbacteria bacterium RIFCSPHIGHO2_01_45_13]OGZ48138.1 MAG: hypothetical protein A3C80_01180 [Candidatus Ryanbacteria bacterium RIFCSPHIGHO2_02_FULL_45_43]OGZ49786.1 MAG: hypothetical protein A3E55_01005 [Candidatus Ryanbacteria bacterium RIFCSPHIGHO2_12_FULL_44_20]OGZ51212.1 MAG: hypothetical protein A3A17_04215 [Candidatus Ryanba
MKPVDVRSFKGIFFQMFHQTPLSQIGVMTIKPGEDSGSEEIHKGDQIVYIIEGTAKVEIGKETYHLTEGVIATVPAGTKHHIYNGGDSGLFFLTIYTPPAY